MDFWKRRQKSDPTSAAICEASSSASDFSADVVSDSDELVFCPICNIALKNDEDEKRVVNQHVDECLNSSLLLDVPVTPSGPKETEKPPPRKRGKTGRIENYFLKRACD
ncbi:hypothetical protein KIN20_031249 [Parelaphostrongylus tenuis]|uniref:UBZ4-type domain-containing protein n=1 Tax=Parelaphostrongylus tenuis TaxID=148309 RepID=A0AAD5WGP6_PARTN|nr:hypothetical protein KIN20_031249 [Parelaphostrongylus tenuis]